MSIFKSTFKPFLIRQINARQNLLSETERPVEFSKYVSSKASWARMTSFVDYEGSSDLAKKYVLMGGTLYNFNSETGTVSLRSGVGGKGASYGGDLGSRQYGIRPMPGITDISTRSLGAYGSLTEATVKFYAWDVKQLEDLSVLFLRPGYRVLVEWGWSMYLDTNVIGDSSKKQSDSKIVNDKNPNYKLENTPFNTINCFDSNITQDGVYTTLETLRQKYSGNYDGVLGSIRNFTYTLMPNGSYECTTIVLSIGDVIDTLRINDTLGQSINTQSTSFDTTNSPDDQQNNNVESNSEIKSQFELLMDDFCKSVDTNENTPIISSIKESVTDIDDNYIDQDIYRYDINLIDNTKEEVKTSQFGSVTITSANSYVPDFVKKDAINSRISDSRSRYFIQLAYFIHILNFFKNAYAERNQTLIDLETPVAFGTDDPNRKTTAKLSNGLCQASYHSISVDPDTCLISNKNAVLFKGIYNEERGFIPKFFSKILQSEDNLDFDYLYDNTNLGQIGNIYLNIDFIINAYKQDSLDNNGYVYLGTFLRKILSKVSFSLGSINDFDIFVSNNKASIIDKHYTELPEDSVYSGKFKINVSGNNTIVRNHKIESKIFQSQATMIAIAAQDRENVSSIQTSTYNYINKGLKDRLLGTITNSKEDQNNTEEESRKQKLQSILSLVEYVNRYILANKNFLANSESNIISMNGYLNTLLVELEGGTDYKAVIPISVELTVDGLSGFTIGEIFTINKQVLPKDYISKSIGFIVTGIYNKIETKGWTTTIASQMCILDQEERQKLSTIKANELRKDLLIVSDSNKYQNLSSIRYYNILAALTVDIVRKGFIVSNDGNVIINSQVPILYTKAAIQEYGAGTISLDNVLAQLSLSGKKVAPPQTPRVYYDRGKKKVAGDTRIKAYNLTDTLVISDIIKSTSFYGYMVSDVKNQFDVEFNRFLSDYKSKNYIKYVANTTTPALINKGGNNLAQSINALEDYIEFKILTLESVSKDTGKLVVPLKLVEGYKAKRREIE